MKGMTDPGVWRRDGQFVLQVLRTHRLSTIYYSASESKKRKHGKTKDNELEDNYLLINTI